MHNVQILVKVCILFIAFQICSFMCAGLRYYCVVPESVTAAMFSALKNSIRTQTQTRLKEKYSKTHLIQTCIKTREIIWKEDFEILFKKKNGTNILQHPLLSFSFNLDFRCDG